MSKLSFRARALDASKPMPVYRSEEIPDLPDFAAINRAVPLMPTGMEKEEECEHHLQRAISAQQAYGQTGDLVIPTPEVYQIENDLYDVLYPCDYKMTRQMIHMQPFAMEQDIPDYDMDSEDEKWVNQQAKKMDITPLQFEEMMDRLEKGSGQHVVTLKEAKLLLKEDDDLIIAVYDYWLNKRLRLQRPLILQVKTEKRDGSTNNNPYVAFRRRTEKMQTRKNRKNDEASYEKMLKLRRDLSRAVTLLEMVKRREKSKREHLHLTVEIFEKRYQANDFNGHILAEVSALKHARPAFVSSVHTSNNVVNNNNNQYTINRQAEWAGKGDAPARKKREYKKRKHKQAASVNLPQLRQQQGTSAYHHDVDGFTDVLSSEDETLSPGVSPSDQEDESDPDGPFAFRRKKSCNYHAPILGSKVANWPWCSPEEGGFGDKRYRYCLTSLSVPQQRCIGFARRRIGRGGRMLLDRAWTPLDEYWSELDSVLYHPVPNGMQPSTSEFLNEMKNKWLHFRPQTPPNTSADGSSPVDDDCMLDDESSSSCSEDQLSVTSCTEFNVESFQTHQEELLAMQRRQQEQQHHRMQHSGDVTSSPSSSSTSFVATGSTFSAIISGSSVDGVDETSNNNNNMSTSSFTLDPASVQFAVSAVVDTIDVCGGGGVGGVGGSSSVHLDCSTLAAGTTHTTNTITTCSAALSAAAAAASTGNASTSANGAVVLSSENTNFATTAASDCLLQNVVLNGPTGESNSSQSIPCSTTLSELVFNHVTSSLSSSSPLPSATVTLLPTTTGSLVVTTTASTAGVGATAATTALVTGSHIGNNPISVLAAKAITPSTNNSELRIAHTAQQNNTHTITSDSQSDKGPNRVDTLVNKHTLPMEVT